MAGDDTAATDEQCPESIREDGRHSWHFDGDDPYIVCFACRQRRDAQTGRVIGYG